MNEVLNSKKTRKNKLKVKRYKRETKNRCQ